MKFGMFIVHILVSTYTNSSLHMLWNFQLTAKNILNFLKKLDYLWLNEWL